MENTRTYKVDGMDCAGCAREVETGVAKLQGVKSVQVDFATAMEAVRFSMSPAHSTPFELAVTVGMSDTRMFLLLGPEVYAG